VALAQARVDRRLGVRQVGIESECGEALAERLVTGLEAELQGDEEDEEAGLT
jgi:hypothetical protein